MSTESKKRAMIAPPERNLRLRRNMMYATVALVAIIAIVVVAMYSRVPKTASDAPTQSAIKVGDSAPQFNVATTNGPFDLKTTLAAGKPVFLEVFATWCPHCQRETHVISALNKKYGAKVAFVGVSGSQYAIDGSSPESQLDVIAFMQKFSVTYPIAFDPNLDVAQKYLSGGFPTFVVINRAGKVVYVNSGEISQTELEKQIGSVST